MWEQYRVKIAGRLNNGTPTHWAVIHRAGPFDNGGICKLFTTEEDARAYAQKRNRQQ